MAIGPVAWTSQGETNAFNTDFVTATCSPGWTRKVLLEPVTGAAPPNALVMVTFTGREPKSSKVSAHGFPEVGTAGTSQCSAPTGTPTEEPAFGTGGFFGLEIDRPITTPELAVKVNA